MSNGAPVVMWSWGGGDRGAPLLAVLARCVLVGWFACAFAVADFR